MALHEGRHDAVTVLLSTITAAPLVPCTQSSGLCVLSFHGLHGLIWEAGTEEVVLLKVYLFVTLFFAVIPPTSVLPHQRSGHQQNAQGNGSQWPPTLAACIFKEPCEEGVFTRTPPTRTTGG